VKVGGGMAELALSDVELRLGNSEVLNGLTFTVPNGNVVALVGPSGSGKSTLLRAVAGLAEPHGGSIRVGERTFYDAVRRVALAAQKRRVGVMFPSDALLPQRTVFENLAFHARFGAAGADDIKECVDRALEQIGALGLAAEFPSQLSVADKVRVAIARALLRKPDLLLLDDPLACLEGSARAEARTWLRQLLTRLGVSTLLTTREPVEAMAVADRVVVINMGIVEQEGAPADVYNEPETVFAAEYMGQSNRLDGTLVENAGTRALLEVMGGRIGGITQTRAPVGSQAVGLIRVERTRIGGGPGDNRLSMKLATQMYVGERWEVVFTRDALTVRAYTTAPLRHESYHVEFPPDALWVF
jgi:iron(III) transport system ATP-binding protein